MRCFEPPLRWGLLMVSVSCLPSSWAESLSNKTESAHPTVATNHHTNTKLSIEQLTGLILANNPDLRASLIADPTQRGRAFDRLRRDYPARREFSAWRLGDTPEPLRLDLLAAGFSP